MFFIDTETTYSKNVLIKNTLLFVQISFYKISNFEAALKTKNKVKEVILNAPVFILSVENLKDEQYFIMDFFKLLLIDEHKQLFFFNAPFDCSMLLKWLYPETFTLGMSYKIYSKIYIKALIWDLFILLKSIHPGHRENSLASWAERLFNIVLDKSLQNSFKKGSDLTIEQIRYMVKDVRILILFWVLLKKENYFWFNTFTNEKIYCFERYKNFELKLINEVIDSNFRGLYINLENLYQIIEDISLEQKEIFKKAKDMWGVDPKKIVSGKSLFTKLDPDKNWSLPFKWPLTEQKQLSFSLKSIYTLRSKYNSTQDENLNVLIQILEIREKLKQIRVFEKSVDKSLNKIFFNYSIYGSITGRMITSKANIQGTPYRAGLRKCISCQPGNCFLIFDIEQEEVKIMAELSKDNGLKNIFDTGLDFHTYTGSLICNKSYQDFLSLKETEPKEFKRIRFLAKKYNFGLGYGMSVKTLQKNLEEALIFQDYKKTERDYHIWHKNYQGISVFGKNMREKYWISRFKKSQPVFASLSKTKQNHHYITSFGGRLKRDNVYDCGLIDGFKNFEHINRFLTTETLNFPIQATGSDVLNEIWLETLKWPDGLARVVLVVHDEFIIETSPEKADEVHNKFQEIIKKVSQKYTPTYGLTVEKRGPVQVWGS